MKLPKPDWRRLIADMRAPESPLRVGGNLAVTIVLMGLFVAATEHLDWITHHLSAKPGCDGVEVQQRFGVG
jgi:hypothetical protein